MLINLNNAVIHDKRLSHQIEAWEWLDKQLTQDQKDGFAKRYRGELKPVVSTTNNWDGVFAAAKKAGAKFPEVVAAQWALESGWGKHTSGKNNYFGLKGSGTTVNTKEFINNQWITIQAGFLDFPDLETCVAYLVDRWYKDYGRFQGVNKASSRNDCARLLVKEGYATDPQYATKLIQIMDRQLNTPGENLNDVINEKILAVPYEFQLDNSSGMGYRECFSSTCAMIAEYYGKVKSDDEYNRIRSKYGDTTSADAQLNTLRFLGLTARFVTNGNAALLENEIRNNRPVAVGWLHQGPVTSPRGGGHWTCCIGFTPTHFVFNDPNGEADMVNGNYVNNKTEKGRGVKYSKKNWLRRWEVDGPGTGWAILVNK